MKKLLIKIPFFVLAVLTLSVVFSLVAPTKAHAWENDNHWEIFVPNWVTHPYPGAPYDGRCSQTASGAHYSAGQNNWVSTRDDPNLSITSTTVPQGTTNLPLNVVLSNVKCYDAGAPTDTWHMISSVSATGGAAVSGIAPNTIAHVGYPSRAYNLGPPWNDVVAVNVIPINLSLPTGLGPGTHVFEISLNGVRRINRRSNGTLQCVHSGGERTGFNVWDPATYAPCAAGGAAGVFTVTVVARPPIGWIDGATCDLNTSNPAYATGWAWDPDAPAGNTSYVKIYADAISSFGGRLVGEGWANIVRSDLGAYPGARGFRIDISAFKDAYRHNLYAEVTNSNGENRITVLSGSPRAGPCALPRCGAYTSTPARPEINQPFSGTATYAYTPGAQGFALHGDMGLDINSIRRNTITFVSPAGVRNWNGGPIPPGTRTNQVTANNVIISTPGTFPISWPVQWLIDGNDNVLKDFLRNTGGGYNWYSASNGGTYATLRCPSSGPITTTVVTMPYLRISGNDVQAGGGLKPSCTPTNNLATILTYARAESASQNTESWEGSGTQFAAFALGEISNFMSAAQSGPRQNSTSGPAGNSQARPVLDLTFGNYNPTYAILNFFPGANTSLFDTRKVEGFGGLSGMSSCVENYYEAINAGGGTQAASPLGSKTINGAVAEYHDGDLVINGNIDFPASWSESTTPSYYLVVRGNIYIQASVDRLAGVYIAQQRTDGTGGRIYTCANGTNLYAGTQLYDACRRRLTVNGAFVAKQIKFLRTIDTLNNGVPNETAANSRAAEVFNFSPETYMANPHPALGTGSRKVQYDFITSLPPIL